jgi:acetylornithine/N-succinyldiaminopimelate aminotransferase
VSNSPGYQLENAVGYAVLDAVLEPGFLDAVRHKTLRLKQALAAVHDRHPDLVEEVRGEGLLAGLKLKVPVGDVIKAAVEEQLLVAGASGNVVRLLPPLNVADEEIADAADRLSRALDRVAARPS